MNLDLIIKLAKLANNNPNEHEANAAARKVCQLLAEGNFNFGLNIEQTKEPDFKSPEYPPGSPFKDVFYESILNDIYEQYARENFYGSKKEQRNKRVNKCIHCRKIMTTVAEIENKICAECWRKEREKFGV